MAAGTFPDSSDFTRATSWAEKSHTHLYHAHLVCVGRLGVLADVGVIVGDGVWTYRNKMATRRGFLGRWARG